jgi:ferrochelatase
MKGILVVNLGTPEAPDTASIRQFLKEFLSDTDVIQKPRWFWQPILHLFILPRRPQKVQPNYQSIWLENGSPIEVYTKSIARKLQKRFPDFHVAYAMTYGKDSILKAATKMKAKGIKEVTVLPLYPQYSTTTTKPIIRQCEKIKELNWHIIENFHQNHAFLDLFSKQIQKAWEKDKYDGLVLSYHGIPKSYVERGDKYEEQCLETTAFLKKKLSAIENVHHVYQSEFGKEEWIGPNIKETLSTIPSKGELRVLVATPSFLCDCLETIDEIGVENKERFFANGGKVFTRVSSPNDEMKAIDCYESILKSEK